MPRERRIITLQGDRWKARAYLLATEVWGRFAEENYIHRHDGMAPVRTNRCHVSKMLFMALPTVVVSHLVLLAAAVFVLIGLPIYLYGIVGYLVGLVGIAAIVGAIIGIIHLHEVRVERRREAQFQAARARFQAGETVAPQVEQPPPDPSVLSLIVGMFTDIYYRLCPLVELQFAPPATPTTRGEE